MTSFGFPSKARGYNVIIVSAEYPKTRLKHFFCKQLLSSDTDYLPAPLSTYITWCLWCLFMFGFPRDFSGIGHGSGVCLFVAAVRRAACGVFFFFFLRGTVSQARQQSRPLSKNKAQVIETDQMGKSRT